jgi:hypothetical protein
VNFPAADRRTELMTMVTTLLLGTLNVINILTSLECDGFL